jgi:hypothetical protein
MVLASGSICTVTRYGMLSYTDPDGTPHWAQYYLYGYGFGSPAVGPTGAIYVPDCGIPGGGFTAVRADAALARTPWPKFRGNARNTGNAQDIAP